MPGLGDQRPPGVDWLVRRVELLEQQVRELSAARSLPSSNFRGGAFKFQDDAGLLRFGLGNVALPPNSFINQDNVYGVTAWDDGGAVVLAVLEGDRGLVYPTFYAGFHSPASASVTSGTFAAIYETFWDLPPAPVLRVQLAVIVPAATTAEIRIVDGMSGQATDTLVLPADYNGFVSFTWLHPSTTGIGDDRPGRISSLFPGLQVRRASGAGTVSVFPPLRQYFASVSAYPDANTNGLPVAS